MGDSVLQIRMDKGFGTFDLCSVLKVAMRYENAHIKRQCTDFGALLFYMGLQLSLQMSSTGVTMV